MKYPMSNLADITEYGSGRQLVIDAVGLGFAYYIGVMAHEQQHISSFNTFQIIYGNPTTDPPDGDGIPAANEATYEGMASNPNIADTYNMVAVGSDYAGYGDDEVRSRYVEANAVTALRSNATMLSKDWANPGCNSSPSYGP